MFTLQMRLTDLNREPGEINLDYLAEQIQNSEFEGTVCMEYFPIGETEKGMPAVKEFLKKFK